MTLKMPLCFNQSACQTVKQHLKSNIRLVFKKRLSVIHAHFMSWLAMCVEVRQKSGFEFLSLALCFHSLQRYFNFHVNSWGQHDECLPGETGGESENKHWYLHILTISNKSSFCLWWALTVQVRDRLIIWLANYQAQYSAFLQLSLFLSDCW